MGNIFCTQLGKTGEKVRRSLMIQEDSFLGMVGTSEPLKYNTKKNDQIPIWVPLTNVSQEETQKGPLKYIRDIQRLMTPKQTERWCFGHSDSENCSKK